MKDEPLCDEVLDHGGDPFLAEMVLLNARLKRTRRRELAFRAFAMLVILALALTVSSLRATVRQQNADRAQARVAACLNANNERAQVRAAFEKSVAAVVPPNPTPEIAARTEAFLKAYRSGVLAGLPDRDCSPAGIDAYYKLKR